MVYITKLTTQDGYDKTTVAYYKLLAKQATEVSLLQEAEKDLKFGNANKMYELGNEYFHSEIIDTDIEKGIKCYEKAISYQHVQAIAKLGYYYIGEDLVTKNLFKAIKLLRRASLLGSVQSTHNLGYIYSKANDNSNLSTYYYKKAAILGHPDSMNNLGLQYLVGNGVEQVISKAIVLFEKAIELGDEGALLNLGKYYMNNGNESRALALFQNGVDLENAEAMYFLAVCYSNGIGTNVNDELADEWFNKALDFGSVEAFHFIESYKNVS